MTANLLISTKAESLPSLIPGPQSLSEGLNPYETEIVSKLDIIIGTLRALEDQFLQTRQEVIKKSSLEGKESAKIFAVKGRVIMNKKRYFRSLEGNIELLTNNLQSQLDKVFQEFKGLKNIAGFDEKTETDGKVSKDPTVNIISPPLSLEVQQSLENLYTSPCIKSVALPSIKRIESAKKTGIANSNKLPLRNLIKASSATNIELPKPESIPNPQIFKSKDSPTPQLNIMSLPSLPEVPEAEAEEAQQTVVRVRLGLLHEIKDDMRTINPKKARPIRGHGFRLSPPSSGHEKKDDQSQRRSVDSQPEPHTLG